MQQPDFGETIIFGSVWLALLALAGVAMRILIGLGVGGRRRRHPRLSFLPGRDDPHRRLPVRRHGDNFQVETAMRTLTAGGLFGTGPGGGTRKFRLPEAHTDYIFSVIGEEFGLIACLAIAVLYLAIVARVLVRLLDEENSFASSPPPASPSSSGCRR